VRKIISLSVGRDDELDKVWTRYEKGRVTISDHPALNFFIFTLKIIMTSYGYNELTVTTP